MSRLHDAIEQTVVKAIGHRASVRTTPGAIHDRIVEDRILGSDLGFSRGDVHEALLQMHRDGRLFLAGNGDDLEISLPSHARAQPAISHQSVSVHGGNVQIGNHNHQTITYSHVLQNLATLIEQAPNIPEKDKKDLLSQLSGVLSHPLVQALVNAGIHLGIQGM